MANVGQIKAPYGANTKKTIVGRGASSKGRACGRGHDGQNSRSGGGVRVGFEGGQMPLYRRVARRGFSNYPFKKEYQVVSLTAISEKFEDGAVVNLDSLKKANLVKGHSTQAKVLSNGEITKKVTIEGLKVSASAVEKITAAGGEIK
ncbi:MAG: 50S ribosomal protein L15 [Pleomorphochaeta sp.]|nr:50S ribosomal protein L15 [Sphaerochaetaceae bacterium]